MSPNFHRKLFIHKSPNPAASTFVPPALSNYTPPPNPTTHSISIHNDGVHTHPLSYAKPVVLAGSMALAIWILLHCCERRDNTNSAAATGLRQSQINSIPVLGYGKDVIEGTECSVCLEEFEEGDSLRVLPKCNHAFHVACIDTWFNSHNNCPLCRAGIAGDHANRSGRNQNQLVDDDEESGGHGSGNEVCEDSSSPTN